MPQTADQFFGGPSAQAGALPTADQFFGSANPLPPPQTGAANDAIWNSGATADSKVFQAATGGFKEGWGPDPTSLSPETSKFLNSIGLLPDFETDKPASAQKAPNFTQAIGEALIKPSIMLATRLPGAVLNSVAAAEAERASRGGLLSPVHAGVSELVSVGREGGFGGLVPEIPEVGAVAARSISAAERVTDAYTARSIGALGEDDGGFYGATPLSPENVQARADAAEQAGIEAPAPPPPAPDLHVLARRIEPETFADYDALVAERQTHADTLERLPAEREASPEITGLRAEIKSIVGYEGEGEAPPEWNHAFWESASAADRESLFDAEGRLDDILNTETPEMAVVRAAQDEATRKMAALSPQVAQAYRHAEEMAPQLAEQPSALEMATHPKGEGERAALGAEAQAGPTGALTTPAPVVVGAGEPAALAAPRVLGDETLGRSETTAPKPAATTTPATETTAAPTEGAPTAEPNPRATIKAIEGQGEQLPQRVAQRTQENAAAVGIAPTKAPTYGQLKDVDRIRIARQVIQDDYPRAVAIAMGRREAPSGTTPETFLGEVERHALATGDTSVIEDLKHTRLSRVGTTMGQRLSSYRTRVEESPVAALQEVEGAREAAYPGDLEADKRATVNDIANEDRNASSGAAAVKSFLDDLTCE